MKKTIIILLVTLNTLLIIPTKAKDKKLILNDKVIVIDPGHGSKDIGTSYNDIYEKDINLSISKYLKKHLEEFGAAIYVTRENDYDLSTPNTNHRKKSDFDNRINFINDINPNLVISIHQNYYKDSKYSGTQIFYKDNKSLSEYLQKSINKDRITKPIDNTLYMYNKINSSVLLIECGFLSNYNDRKKLINDKFQDDFSKRIAKYIAEYYKDN